MALRILHFFVELPLTLLFLIVIFYILFSYVVLCLPKNLTRSLKYTEEMQNVSIPRPFTYTCLYPYFRIMHSYPLRGVTSLPCDWLFVALILCPPHSIARTSLCDHWTAPSLSVYHLAALVSTTTCSADGSCSLSTGTRRQRAAHPTARGSQGAFVAEIK